MTMTVEVNAMPIGDSVGSTVFLGGAPEAKMTVLVDNLVRRRKLMILSCQGK